MNYNVSKLPKAFPTKKEENYIFAAQKLILVVILWRILL